ncbi:MAG: hypothetical protein QXJ27_05255 [Thermoplasmata archaeon]
MDTETKQVLSVATTDDRVGETIMFREIVSNAKESVEVNGEGRVSSLCMSERKK